MLCASDIKRFIGAKCVYVSKPSSGTVNNKQCTEGNTLYMPSSLYCVENMCLKH